MILYGSHTAIQFAIYPHLAFTPSISGALAASLATIATFPLDTLRTRMALSPKLLVTTRLYKGLLPTLCSTAPHSALVFGVQDRLKSHGLSSGPSGFIAGITAKSLLYPLDVLRKRMQVSGTNGYIVGVESLWAGGLQGIDIF